MNFKIQLILASIFLIMAVSFSAEAAANPLGLWQFEEVDDFTTPDSAGSNTAYVREFIYPRYSVGGPILGVGISDVIIREDGRVLLRIHGHGLEMDGSNDVVTIPYTASLQPAQLTLSAWIKSPGPKTEAEMRAHLPPGDTFLYNSEQWMFIVGQGDHAQRKGYALYLNENGRPVFRLNGRMTHNDPTHDTAFWHSTEDALNPATPAPGAPASVDLRDNQWHFVVATFDGRVRRIYVDGREIAREEQPLSSTGGWAIEYGPYQTNFGADSFATYVSKFFKGTLDEVAIYNRALSAADIGADYDADSDTVINYLDNCPLQANTGQSDLDADGVGDVCDTTSETDTDGDGVPNATDNCDAVANPAQTDTDGDGIGDACEGTDTDGDGVPDTADNCDTTANPAQTDIDGDGIGDACESTLTADEQDYTRLQDLFDGYDRDYDDFKERYEDAEDDENEDRIDRYQEKLEDLQDDLDDLVDDVDALEDRVRERSTVDRDLLDDIDTLRDDAERLSDRIDSLLDKDKRDENALLYSSSIVQPPSAAASSQPAVAPPQVTYDQAVLTGLDLTPPPAAAVDGPDNWKIIMLLAAGVVVTAIVIIFLLAAVLRKN